MKVCTQCNQLKPFTSYYKASKSRGAKNGLRSTCVECHRADYQSNKVNILNKQRLKRSANAGLYRGRAIQYKFGLTPEAYRQLLISQDGVCAICRQAETCLDTTGKRIKALAVDHCHKTGKIRGLLCANCNLSLGKLRDRPEFFRSAANYLETKCA